MFAKTLNRTRAQDVTIGQHRVRISVSYDGRGGMYDPHVNLFLRGPNGSRSGVGPKTWPLFRRLTITVPLPRISWARGYRLRRFGGIAAYKAVSRFYRTILS